MSVTVTFPPANPSFMGYALRQTGVDSSIKLVQVKSNLIRPLQPAIATLTPSTQPLAATPTAAPPTPNPHVFGRPSVSRMANPVDPDPRSTHGE